jgi:sugar phosphate isomerase/epimerase
MKKQLTVEYPFLPKSYKGMFPFKICTTSFIYPDHYIPNVKMLGPFMDEIELLLFESQEANSIPSRAVIAELGQLGRDFDLSYNVHLPTDVSLTDQNHAHQENAVKTMIRVIERVQPLCPSALILHLPYDETDIEQNAISWRDRVYKNLKKILPVVENSKLITIETLDYPLELLADIPVDLDLSICLDLGHLMVYDYDILEVFNKYASSTSVLHLHGVENRCDHTTLEKLSDTSFSTVRQVLARFTGVVSIEVFSFENLVSSLKYLERHWRKN